MDTLTYVMNWSQSSQLSNENYEVIENEMLTDADFKGLTVSGALFSLTTFRNVTFRGSVFFASKIENCTFVNCNFIDCSFQFSSIIHSLFRRCSFEQSRWELSTISDGCLIDCQLDYKTSFILDQEPNQISASGKGGGESLKAA
ncbi:MAG: hypothetical protein HN353_09250 [Bdellovibrionales bacterium]|nr:hypothetical protein [Bdellovibrionales bacterium]MBT3527318.1 hypothetical protein [Bdellovibrionales bacterium]MBT7668512.1 hypothetical protein [Bdellovibrionales bacterium]